MSLLLLLGRVGQAAQAPLPDAIPGLELWLKSDVLNQADGTNVQTWYDYGFYAYDAVQNTLSAQPKFYNNVLNGKPVVRFAGAQGMVSQASSTLAAMTQFFVHKPTSLSTSGTLRGSGQASGNHGLQVRVNGGRLDLLDANTALYGSAGTDISITQFNVSTFAATGGGTAQIYRNGIADGSFAINTGYTTGGPYTCSIGVHDVGVSSEFFAGDIAEVISYSRVLTTTERAQVHTYLQNKYAITVADYIPAASGPPPGQFLPFFI